MMGTKGKISAAALALAVCGIFAAILYCALEWVAISCAVGAAAAATACIGIYFAFGSWEEKEESARNLSDLLLHTELEESLADGAEHIENPEEPVQ